MTNANALPIQERRLQERLRDQQFDKGQYYPFEHWFLVEAADKIDALEKALREAVATITDYVEYQHDGDPWTEDARTMGEMDINEYATDGRLAIARAALGEGE